MRVIVNLPEELMIDLQALADRQGKYTTRSLAEAISLKLFVDEQIAAGSKLLIERRNGAIREVVFS